VAGLAYIGPDMGDNEKVLYEWHQVNDGRQGRLIIYQVKSDVVWRIKF
jgi:hypothetical protein